MGGERDMERGLRRRSMYSYTLQGMGRRRRTCTSQYRTQRSSHQKKHDIWELSSKGLRFRQHIQYAANKGTKFALAISRIAKSTLGATYVQTRTLFSAVVAARMDYAAIVWHRPTKHEQPPASLSKLETAQRTAMKAILGAFRTTTTSAMEIDTSLLPAHLRLRRKI